MDTTAIIGLALGIGGILIGNILEGGHTGSLIQVTAGIIVFSGTLGAVVLSNRKKDLQLGLRFLRKIFQNTNSAYENSIVTGKQ